MSNARPMSDWARQIAYDPQETGTVTARQQRQYRRMANRAYYREIGELPAHGASGFRVRKPLRGGAR